MDRRNSQRFPREQRSFGLFRRLRGLTAVTEQSVAVHVANVLTGGSKKAIPLQAPPSASAGAQREIHPNVMAVTALPFCGTGSAAPTTKSRPGLVPRNMPFSGEHSGHDHREKPIR
jgi:hypothetical protein